jgi:hypothetical protein
MWPDLIHYLPEFPSAVLTGLDAEGYPFSQRCQPQVDSAAQVLRLDLSPDVPVQPGRACLLCHRHDERLWNLKSFVVQGRLERIAEAWQLRPERFIPGMGIGGIMSYVGFVLNGRKTAARYWRKRGRPKPGVPWRELDELMTWANDDLQT